MIKEFFAPGGTLSQQFTSYEARPEQVTMAEAVEKAAQEGRDLMVEAGTGVGKSIGYLAPIVNIIKDKRTVTETIHDPVSDETKTETRPRRVIVSTGTINLQRQLMDKELPLLKKLFPWLTYSMAVGSENYLCNARLRKAIAEVGDNPLIQGEAGDIEILDRWSRETKTGLRMDLPNPVSPAAWALVNRQSDLCRCREWAPQNPCFYRKAKQEMREANVILVNHHLLMAQLTIEHGSILPGFDYLVVDEIHSLEEVATQCFGIEVSNYKIDRLVKDTHRVIRSAGAEMTRGDDIREVFDNVGKASDKLFYLLRQHIDAVKKDSVRLRRPLIANLDQVEMIEQMNKGAKLMEEGVDGVTDPQKAHEVRALAKRAKDTAKQVSDWLLQGESDHVYQIVSESGGKRIVAKSNPVDISKYLKACLWDLDFPTIGTSATISTGGTMTFVKGKLGADDADELVLASPFNYAQNAIVYIASDLPEAKGSDLDPAYYNAMVARVADLLKISRGRAMVLCTSNQAMKTLGTRLRSQLPELKIMIQGEEGGMERHVMVEELKRNPRAVILGVASFWQGVDVPGDALQMVVIPKLPFPNVGDPLFEARAERIDAAASVGGGRAAFMKSSFMLLSLPETIIKLKQGFGRLIRTNTDWGVVAILDTRVITKGYGKTILKSLPPTYIKTGLGEVGEFFRMRQPADEPPAPQPEPDIEEVPF